jgi:hypothetical protein
MRSLPVSTPMDQLLMPDISVERAMTGRSQSHSTLPARCTLQAARLRRRSFRWRMRFAATQECRTRLWRRSARMVERYDTALTLAAQAARWDSRK